jgi:hypothetical protein
MNHRSFSSFFGSNLGNKKNVLFILGVMISISWVGDQLLELFECCLLDLIPFNKLLPDYLATFLKILIPLGIGLFFIRFVYNRVRKHLKDDNIKSSKAGAAPKAKVLIMYLSNKSNGFSIDALQTEKPFECSGCDSQFTWQLNLLACAYHAETLQTLYVIGSEGEKGSAKEIHTDFLACIDKVFPNKKFNIIDRACDFTEVDSVKNSLIGIYQEVEQDRIKEEDVIVDVTSGTKPVSIGASIATLAQGRLIQYTTRTTCTSFDLESY